MKTALVRILKYLHVFLLPVFIFLGCGLKIDPKTDDLSFLTDKSLILKQFDVETKTGRKYNVTVTRAMGDLINILVIGIGFESSQDTIRIRGVDSLEQSVITDLNSDGYEELYFFTRYSGPERYGIVYAISSMKDKSCERIIIDEMREALMKEGRMLEGYRGHDRYYMENDKLVREFPVMKQGSNSQTANEKRKLFYSLVDGDTCFFLTVKSWETVR